MAAELEYNKLTGAQKAAIVLLALPQDKSAQIMSSFSEDEIRNIAYHMSNLRGVHPTTVGSVLNEFRENVLNNSVFIGNLANMEELLKKVVGVDGVREIMKDAIGPGGRDTWERLGKVNEETLAKYSMNEHRQIIAVMLSKLPPDRAAAVLSNIKDDTVIQEVLARILNMGSVNNSVLDTVEKVVKSEFVIGLDKASKQDTFEIVAGIFNHLDKNSESRCVQHLERINFAAASKVKDLMFTFSKLYRIDSKGIRLLLRNIDRSKLPTALKGASEEIKSLIFANLSQRAVRMIEDEMESLRVRVRDVQQAQSHIMSVAKRLIANGDIELLDTNESESYV